MHNDYAGARINVAKEARWEAVFEWRHAQKFAVLNWHHGKTMRDGYFQCKMDNEFENPWSYGEDILMVRDEGVRLGLIREPKEAREATS
ncbi:hypothetical protein [Pseudomonas sp. NPDC086251]|uniref:hypothetical protein n=1 Tax=Pseudomonas sp. NPDC086251 TaxID=3364431 RepID=UPI0038387C04